MTQTWQWTNVDDRSGDLPGFKRLCNLRFGKLRDRLDQLQTDLGWINVADSGATGNGATDDTAAIERAMTKMGDNSLLFFPPGQYRITGRPTCPNFVNNVYYGPGAELLLDDPNANGFRLSGAYRQLVFEGFRITSSAATTDSVTGIGTDVTPSAFVGGSTVRFVDVKVLGTNRGLYMDLQTAGDWRDVEFWACRAEQIVGTAAHYGYGIAATIWGGSVNQCSFDLCQRHSLYLSICRGVQAGLNNFRRHRFGVANGSQLGALEIARSGNISWIGNTFDQCDDGAVSIEPHEADPTAYTSGIVGVGNTFLNSVRQDVFVGGPSDPSAMSDLTDITLQGNHFSRSEAASAGSESIRHFHGRRLRLLGNDWTMPNAYTVIKDIIVTNALGGETFSEGFEADDNRVYLTAGVGGSTRFIDLSAAQSVGTLPLTVKDTVMSGGAPTAIMAYGAARTNTAISLRGNVANGGPISDATAIVGMGVEQDGPLTLRATVQTPSALSGTDIAGTTLNVLAGAGTGAGSPGEFRVFVGNQLVSGVAGQGYTLVLRLVAPSQDVVSAILNSPTTGLGRAELLFRVQNVAKADLGIDGGGGGLITGSVAGDWNQLTRGGRMLFSVDSGSTLHALLTSAGLTLTNDIESTGVKAAIASTAVDLTLSAAHYMVTVDASGAARTITLPAAASHTKRVYVIKKIDSSGNTVTVDGNAAELIDGAATKVLAVQYASVVIQSDGTSWWVQ